MRTRPSMSPSRPKGTTSTAVTTVSASAGAEVKTQATFAAPGDYIVRLRANDSSITSAGQESTPDYLLIHDRRDGACWLWSFDDGLRFIEATEPTAGDGWDDAETPKLLGP